MKDRLQQLEQDCGIEWKEYELSQFFEIQNTSSFNKDKLTAGSEYDYVTRTSQNQGIFQTTGFVNQNNINSAGTWSLGLLQMDFFYRQKPWYAGQFVRKIIPKIKLSKSAILYFTAVLNRQKKNLLSGLVRDVDRAFLNAKVSLPTKNSQIAFDFIELFITALNDDRLATLNAYLTATGLKDCSLTAEEQATLDSVDYASWREFGIGDLFEVGTGSLVDIKSAKHGKVPRVSVQTTDNGIFGYYEDPIENARYFKNFVSVNFFGISYYHPYRASVEMKVHTLRLKDRDFTAASGIFFSSLLTKRFAGLYSYGNQLSSSKLKNGDIKLRLPFITKNGKTEIDFDLIESIISLSKKVVIKNVVDYSDMRIEKTEEVSINNQQ